jgi:hypothetical protein
MDPKCQKPGVMRWGAQLMRLVRVIYYAREKVPLLAECGPPLRFESFPRRGSVLQPRVAVLGYPGKDGGKWTNPNGVAAGPHVESA